MTYTSDRPISIDGVRLDSLAYNIEKINRAVASRRASDTTVPGLDGGIPSVNDDLEPALFGLEMWLQGTDPDGAIPASSSRRQALRDNLDELLHLFGTRHRLLEVTEQVTAGPNPQLRRALAKVVDSIAPNVDAGGGSGRFAVSLTIPSGAWEDAEASDWDSGGSLVPFQDMEVTTLRDGTERTNDAIILVKGPWVNPQVIDVSTDAFVMLNGTLAAGEFWRVNVGTWASRTGSDLTLDSSDAAGVDAQARTKFGGMPNMASFLPLVPARDLNNAGPVATGPDGVPYVTPYYGPSTALALDADGIPYVTDQAAPGAAIAFDTDGVPYVTGLGGPATPSRTRRVRIAVAGSGITSASRVLIRARRKFAA